MKAFEDSAKQYQPLLPFFTVWDKKVREENIPQSGPYSALVRHGNMRSALHVSRSHAFNDSFLPLREFQEKKRTTGLVGVSENQESRGIL